MANREYRRFAGGHVVAEVKRFQPCAAPASRRGCGLEDDLLGHTGLTGQDSFGTPGNATAAVALRRGVAILQPGELIWMGMWFPDAAELCA